MIKKQDLKQIDNLRKEIKYIEDKIDKLNSKPVKIVQDSVSASSPSFPYTRHTAKIEGFESPKNRNKYRKILKDKKYSLEKKINNLEYELNTLLFYRTNRGIELTPEAKALLVYVEKAYQIYDFRNSGKKDYVPSKEQLEEMRKC